MLSPGLAEVGFGTGARILRNPNRTGPLFLNPSRRGDDRREREKGTIFQDDIATIGALRNLCIDKETVEKGHLL